VEDFLMNVIYVDDERMALECFEYEARSLKEIAQLNLFDRAEEALHFARQNEVDVAFLDIEMPDMSGLLLARALRSIQPDICIIFVTAYSNYALEAFNADAIGYILKPYDREAIEHALHKAMRMTPVHRKQIIYCGRSPHQKAVFKRKIIHRS
jgi:DNA-binding LytR/AlgR family response regulator